MTSDYLCNPNAALLFYFFFQAEDGIRDKLVTGVQTCALPISRAYELAALRHNALGVTEPLPTRPRDFFGRPFKVIALHGFAAALRARIDDEAVKRIAARRPIGGIDQFSDSTDLISHTQWRATLRKLYE